VAKARIGKIQLGILAVVGSLFAATASLAQPIQNQIPANNGGFATTQVVVRLRADAFARSTLSRANVAADADALPKTGALRGLASSWRATRMRRVYENAFANPALAEKHGLDRTFVLEVPAGTDTVRLAKALGALEEIELASPDETGGIAGDPIIPSDGFFGDQWGMHNTGQAFFGGQPGTSDADIDAPEAWGVHTGVGEQEVIVAVLDSGVSSHPDFGTNLGPTSTGRILPGWNTVLNSGSATNLIDNCGSGHGTHVAGIIGAAGGPSCSGGTSDTGKTCVTAADCAAGCVGGSMAAQLCVTNDDCPGGTCGVPACAAIGVAGVSWGVHILPVKILTGCSGLATDLSEGIIWAADNGADIINLSVQFNITSQASITAMQSAVDYAHDLGVLLIAATGNQDNCSNGLPPANDTVCYPARMANVLAVSASDNKDLLWTSSNYGNEVDVAAPGKDIRSTILNGSYGYLSGTSMATPHVSGLAALVKSYVPDLTNYELENIIIATAEDRGAAGWDIQFGSGRINAHQALLAAAQWPGILESSPPDLAIDAAQPFDRNTLEPQGWSSVEVRFPRDAGGVASADFVIEQTVAGTPPAIVAVEPLEPDRVRVVLDRPIDPLAWTTITHVATDSRIRLGFLPADADGDAFSSPADLLGLIDSLNGVTPRPIWSTDIDRSGIAAPADILTLIDLLNGAAPFNSFNGASLPAIP
jgi:subtilisin family serine protease